MVVFNGGCFVFTEGNQLQLLPHELAMSSLWEACRTGNLEGCHAALGRGEDVNSIGRDTNHWFGEGGDETTCLLIAIAYYGDVYYDSDGDGFYEEVVDLLLDQPALDKNAKAGDHTALQYEALQHLGQYLVPRR